MFFLLSLLYSIALIINSVVILDERRFLNKLKLPLSKIHRSSLPPANQKIVEIISILRTLELPLIVVNILFVVYEMF